MSITEARSRVAIESKKYKKVGGQEPPPSLQDAKRALAEEKLAQYIERTVASAPKLTPAQVRRLSVLLHSGVTGL